MDTLKPGSLDIWGEQSCNEEEFFRMRLALGDLSRDEVMDREDINKLLKKYPHWTIQCGASAETVTKTYRRDLSDIPRKKFTRTGIDSKYLNTLFEPELFDPAISTIFGGIGSGSSILGCFVVVSYDSEPSITPSDILKIADAEQYLHDAGYIPQPEQEAV